jgi:hypothetical protein
VGTQNEKFVKYLPDGGKFVGFFHWVLMAFAALHFVTRHYQPYVVVV